MAKDNDRDEDLSEENGETRTINYEIFRDCLAEVIIQKLNPVSSNETRKKKKRRNSKYTKKPPEKDAISNGEPRNSEDQPIRPDDSSTDTKPSDAEDLAEFIEYLTDELFPSLPQTLQDLCYSSMRNNPLIDETYALPLSPSTVSDVIALIPPSTVDSLHTYGLLPTSNDNTEEEETTYLLTKLLDPLLSSYIKSATAPPASIAQQSSKPPACELCSRDWIPLSYHHLIPRSTHEKALKRGWHEEWKLNSVAWLCRACHSFVHSIESNEELARNWFSLELLKSREDVRGFVGWVGGVRWRKR